MQRDLFLPQFDAPEDAAAAREAGIAAADLHADPDWKEAAWSVLVGLAAQGTPFTSDHVWLQLDRDGVEFPHTRSALGPVTLRAVRERLIRKTGRMVPSRFARRHRDLTEWVGEKSDG